MRQIRSGGKKQAATLWFKGKRSILGRRPHVRFSNTFAMKKNALLTIALFLPVFLLCQKPFAPLGARWGGTVQCSPAYWPCPPDYPYYYTFEVTEDTVIQGKYCTLIYDRDWGFGNEKTILIRLKACFTGALPVASRPMLRHRSWKRLDSGFTRIRHPTILCLIVIPLSPEPLNGT